MVVTEESVCIYGTISMSWVDEILTWNPADHGGVKEISPPVDILWRPNIAFSRNPSACNDRESNVFEMVTIANDGRVSFLFHGYMATECIIDVKLFPFDHHECVVHLIDNKGINEVVLQTQDYLVEHEVSFPHAEWIVNDIVSSLNVKQVSGNISASAFYRCWFKVSRRPGFIIIHNIIPAGFVVLLSLFVPVIPPDTGERLSYAITTYLATVFMTVSFYDNIPNSSLCITLMSYNLVTYYAISSLSLIWSIGIVCLSKQTTEQMKIPNYITKRLEKKKTGDHSSDSKMKAFDDCSKHTIVDDVMNTDNLDIIKVDNNANMSRIGWYETSRYLDKLFFIFTLICYIFLLGWNILVIQIDEFNSCKSIYQH
ncbi:hypothetical protein ACF0H5_000849 [Mactra antiquata]